MFGVVEVNVETGPVILERYEDYGIAQQRANALNAALDPGDRDWVVYRVEYCPVGWEVAND